MEGLHSSLIDSWYIFSQFLAFINLNVERGKNDMFSLFIAIYFQR